MARFSGGSGGGSGAPGPAGPQGLPGEDGALGPAGADALWNFVGEYSDGGDYNIGDVVTYLGGTYYRVLPPNTGYAPGTEYWITIAAPGSSGQGGDTADFIFTNDENETGRSIISLPSDKGMTIAAGEGSDLYITAGDDLYIQTLGEGDDIHLNAADDIRFTTNNEDNLDGDTDVPSWSMDAEGRFQLPGNGYISNPIQTGASTIVLDPESYGNDQKLVIDATAPNHIHVRAGGEIDNSTAELYLGGEDAHVMVSDYNHQVQIKSTGQAQSNSYFNNNSEAGAFVTWTSADIQIGDTVVVDGQNYAITSVIADSPGMGQITVQADGASFAQYTSYSFDRTGPSYSWEFSNDGTLYGPGEGGLTVTNLYGQAGDDYFSVVADQNLVLQNGNGYGTYLNDSAPEDHIATIGDLNSLSTIQGSSSIFLALVRFATNTTSYAAYSVDGVTWTLTTMPQNAGWTSSIYAEGKYVATGFGVSAHSLNGVDWTLGTGSVFARNVTYGNGKFVGVGNFGGVSYSEDGINWSWTESVLPAGPESHQNDWLDVAYGGGKFVAVRLTPGVFAYSDDGITWSQATGSPGDSFWYSVTYGNDRFVAVGAFGGTAYSLDGINWTRSSSNSGFSITYGDGKFVAVSGNVKYSTDGITWTVGSMPINAFAVTYGNGKFVAVSNSTNESAYSVDGINWTASTLPISDEWHSVSASDVELQVPLQIASEAYVNAVIGDLSVETSFTVVGGTADVQPTFNGDPLFSGTYVKTGPIVHFQIQVDMDNITSFGTGQYYVTLPFPAKYGYKFREGCLHDTSTGRDYAVGGHVAAGSSTLELTSTDTQSGAVFDIPFTATAPVTLNVSDNFHIAGTYIA